MDTKTRGGKALAQQVRAAYDSGMTDYYMEPFVKTDAEGKPVGRIEDGDTVIFCCRRGEREIEMTDMFTDASFDKIARPYLPNLHFVTLTQYHEKFTHLPTAYAPIRVHQTLAQQVAAAGLSQLHCAESEKFAHVTFFLNGGTNEPFAGEQDVCIPSPRGVPFDQVPALSLPAVADRVIEGIGQYDFIATNFANGDVIGHTQSAEAKVAAAMHVDMHLSRVVEAAMDEDYVVLITADHGNLEAMVTEDGKPHVAHTTNLVPFIALDGRPGANLSPRDGSLADVAPTVLGLLGLMPHEDMTGQSLLAQPQMPQGRRVLLIILDGWGMGERNETDAVFLGDTRYFDALMRTAPHSMLHASGEHVGLAAGKPGNSEAGHLNIGAGRVVLQDDQRIDRGIEDGSFMANPALVQAIEKTRKEGCALHLIAYLTEKSSHGSIAYPLAICRMAKDLPRIYLHIVFDGRSTQPGSAPAMLLALDETLADIGAGEIVGGVGRGLVLDRDGNYDKVLRAYEAMVSGVGARY